MSIKKIKWMLPVVAVIMSMLTGCLSDGDIGSRRAADDTGTSESATKVNSFKVRKADAAASEGKSSLEIEKGDSIILSWDVTAAKTIGVHCNKHNDVFKDKALAPKDELRMDNVSEGDTFTLVIKGGKDGEMDQRSVTVTIRKKEPATIVSFEARPDTIAAGETAQLCYELSDKHAKFKIMDGETLILDNTDLATEESKEEETTDAVSVQNLMLAKVATPDAPKDPYAGSDEGAAEETTEDADNAPLCVGVEPEHTTTYTLTVINEDGSAGNSKEAKVTVREAEVSVQAFTAQPSQLGAAGEVTLTWRVMPEDAVVTVEPGVVSNHVGNGEFKVKINATTTFKLTATKGGKTAEREVTVPVGGFGGASVRLTATTQSVFAGEAATFKVTADSIPSKVTVLDPAGTASEASVENGVVTVANPVSGSYTVEANGARSNAVTIEVRGVRNIAMGGWFGLEMSGSSMIAGKSGSVDSVSLAQITGLSSVKSVDLKYGEAYEKKAKYFKETLDRLGTYTVRSAAFDANSGRVYAGITGSVIYSEDKGSSWQILDVITMHDTVGTFKDKPESHKGCDGATRTGLTTYVMKGMVNVADVCDVKVIAKGDKARLLIATDFFGVLVKDGDSPISGYKKSDNVLFGKVVNTIEVSGSSEAPILVAGTSDGVYVNTQAGDPKAWQQIDKEGLSGAVNAVAVSGSTIFAGTDKGLFKYEGLGTTGKWSAIAVAASTDAVVVKALAIDAANKSTVYVGTKDGLLVGRNCGSSFAAVKSATGDVRNIATASDGSQSTVAIAGSKGLFVSTGIAVSGEACSATTGTRPESAPTQQTPVAEKPTTGPGTVTPK